MIHILVVRPEARKELEEAYQWYEAQRQGLGEELKDSLLDCVAKIRDGPDAYPAVSKNVRRARLKRFPYAVFFHTAGESLVIDSVFHLRRNPKAWRRRIRETG